MTITSTPAFRFAAKGRYYVLNEIDTATATLTGIRVTKSTKRGTRREHFHADEVVFATADGAVFTDRALKGVSA